MKKATLFAVLLITTTALYAQVHQRVINSNRVYPWIYKETTEGKSRTPVYQKIIEADDGWYLGVRRNFFDDDYTIVIGSPFRPETGFFTGNVDVVIVGNSTVASMDGELYNIGGSYFISCPKSMNPFNYAKCMKILRTTTNIVVKFNTTKHGTVIYTFRASSLFKDF